MCLCTEEVQNTDLKIIITTDPDCSALGYYIAVWFCTRIFCTPYDPCSGREEFKRIWDLEEWTLKFHQFGNVLHFWCWNCVPSVIVRFLIWRFDCTAPLPPSFGLFRLPLSKQSKLETQFLLMILIIVLKPMTHQQPTPVEWKGTQFCLHGSQTRIYFRGHFGLDTHPKFETEVVTSKYQKKGLLSCWTHFWSCHLMNVYPVDPQGTRSRVSIH